MYPREHNLAHSALGEISRLSRYVVYITGSHSASGIRYYTIAAKIIASLAYFYVSASLFFARSDTQSLKFSLLRYVVYGILLPFLRRCRYLNYSAPVLIPDSRAYAFNLHHSLSLRLSETSAYYNRRVRILMSCPAYHLTRLFICNRCHSACVYDINVRRFIKANRLVTRLFHQAAHSFRIVLIHFTA